MSEAGGGLVEERVKVDRKRFEQMLSEGSLVGCDADSFFKRVMRSTNTQIMWPPKLKPGTKSKKDPHVRITGSPNSINAAKEIIFEQLDTRRNRVTLKMDVAFTDHSHIIGKGGRSIQRVMDETGCHIHFPDSNRTNTAEKSNQVSIAGSAEGVEQSRCRIREMLPITVQFNLPINTGLHSPPTLDPQSPQLQAIQQSYGITITFRCDGSKCDDNNVYFESSRILTVAVRGARSHLFGLRQGLAVLIEYLTGFRANSINVPLTMTIDVAVQHHSFIAGRANCNIKSIMQSTGALITMPDISLGSLSTANSLSDLTTSSSAAQDLHSSLTSNSTQIANNDDSNPDCASNNLNLSNISRLFTFDSNNNNNNATNSNSNLNHKTNLLASPMRGGAGGGISSASSSISDLTSICGQQASSFLTEHETSSNNQQQQSTLINQTFHGSNPNLTSATSNQSNLSCRKTAIVIKGPNFESVYNAWQELLGYLPLILIFDLKEGQDLDPVQVTKLMEQMRQISILIKPKQRQNTKSIVVRGPEKDSRHLFEVRKQILKLDEPDTSTSSSNYLKKAASLLSSSALVSQLSAAAVSKQQHQKSIVQQHQQLAPSSSKSSITAAPSSPSSQQQLNQQAADIQMKAIRAILEPNLEKTRQPTPYWAGLGFSKSVSEPMIKEKLSIGPLFSSNLIDERRISYSNENTIHDLCGSLQTLSLDHQQRASSSKVFSDLNNNINILANLNSMNNNNNNNNNNINISNNNINKLKGLASNVIDSNNRKSGNIPNNNPTATSPTTNTKLACKPGGSNQNSPVAMNQTTNVSNNQKISSCLRLAVFLGRIGLVQYLGLFTQHDIDLEMLLSLTENDFVELGLPYIHRRKLAIAIADVKSTLQSERKNQLSSSSLSSTFDAAPGAERSRRMKARGPGELSDIWSM